MFKIIITLDDDNGLQDVLDTLENAKETGAIEYPFEVEIDELPGEAQ